MESIFVECDFNSVLRFMPYNVSVTRTLTYGRNIYLVIVYLVYNVRSNIKAKEILFIYKQNQKKPNS